MAKRHKPNIPNTCCVAGCKTDQSHLLEVSVKRMMRAYENPSELAGWAEAGMKELVLSVKQDLEAKRHFGWVTRLRQIEELYIRTIYTLLIAASCEVPHLLSNELPNGFSAIYKKVNASVFGDRGRLMNELPGLYNGSFTAMSILNQGAHVSFASMLTVIGMKEFPLDETRYGGYLQQLDTYLSILHRVRKLFEQGRSREQVLENVRLMYKPESYWVEQQSIAKGLSGD